MSVRSDEDERRGGDDSVSEEVEEVVSLDLDERLWLLLRARESENREGFDSAEDGEDASEAKLDDDDVWDLCAFFDLGMDGVGASPEAWRPYLSWRLESGTVLSR